MATLGISVLAQLEPPHAAQPLPGRQGADSLRQDAPAEMPTGNQGDGQDGTKR